MHFFHYGRREHLEQFFKDGSFQLKPHRSYDTAAHGQMIGDDLEGHSFEVITDDNYQSLPDDKVPAMFGIPMFGSPGSRGNVFQRTNIAANYLVFCMSHILHADLCRDFCPEYDAVLAIFSPFVFLHEITNAFAASGLVDQVDFKHVADVHYRSRSIMPGSEIREEFTKEPKYAHQAEVRATWFIGEPTAPHYRFKAPRAAHSAGLIYIDEMPSYGPEASPEEKREAYMRAFSGWA